MSARKASSRVLSALLALCMVIGLMPMGAFAAETDTLTASLEEAKTFIDTLTVNNSSNDPEKVVTTVGTHFTWDNEKRENSKKYLYEWSYYNGVVFEGLDYVYDVTGDATYYNYVKEYLDAMITDGALNSYAGYVDYHGADCYKTASLLLDYYKLTGDSKYLSVAETLYADLDAAAEEYLLSDAGNNYRHTWASDPTYDLWLDGLYMIMPFQAEYAAYTNDTEELDEIVSRLTWVSENMYNDGMFYHAANSATSNSGTYWLRSIGWYAAAIVDVMDSVSGDNRAALKTQLKKLVDGMLPYQRETGLWSNAVNGTVNSGDNREETSGTALMAYAIMKAVNNGWLDESYAEYAQNAFVGICENYLADNVLTNICFKGAPGDTSNFNYDNEGKGVGPFIMAYAEILEYVNEQEEEVPETTEAPTEAPTEAAKTIQYITVNKGDGTPYVVGDTLLFELYIGYTDGSGTTVTQDECTYVIYDLTTNEEVALDTAMNTPGSYYAKVTYAGTTLDKTVTFTVSADGDSGYDTLSLAIYGAVLTADIKNVTEDVADVVSTIENVSDYVAYDIKATINEGETAKVSIPVPAEWTVGELAVYHITDEGTVSDEEIVGEYNSEEGVYTFTAEHFTTYTLTNSVTPAADDETTTNSVSGTGNLVGGTTYTLDTDGVTANKNYLIVNTGSDGTGYALTNDESSTTVTISNGTITVADDSDIAWVFSGSTSGTVTNGSKYIYMGQNDLISTSSRNLTISNQSNGAYSITRSGAGGGSTYYLRYNNGSWSRQSSSNTVYTVYLYEKTGTSEGEAVTFTVTPGSATILPDGTTTLTGTVTVAGETVALSNCTITWASANTSYATVSGGTVTGVADGTTNITATLSAVNGTALQENIVLTIPVTVQSKQLHESIEPVLSGNSQINVTLNETPSYSNIKYTVTYEDESTDVFTEDNGLTFGTCDTTTSGKKVVDIYYNGTWVGEVVVNVTVDFSELGEATDYPQYPNDGAVRIDKTATHNAEEFNRTGVTRVELDVAGISVRQGVDVVLVVDISNSMGWSLENAGNSADADRVADDGQTNKLKIAMDSACDFADILLADNNGSTTDNTLSFVTFAGYDATFGNDGADTAVVDSLLEVFRQVSDADAAKVSFEGTEMTYTTTYQIKVTDEEGNVVVSGANRGDTNYDYAFWQAMQTVNAIQAANEANGQGTREVYIVFMTDGAPSHYNHNNKSGASGRDDYWPNMEGSYKVANNYTTSKDTWYSYFSGSANTYAKELYDAVNGNFYAIGFDLAHGGYSVSGTTWQWTQDELVAVLEQVAYHGDETRKIEVAATADADELQTIYAELATKLRYAGTEAVVTDTVGSNFSVQLAPYVLDNNGNQITLATAPTITIKTYDLYPKGSTDSEGNDITGERTGDSTDIEIVTFNADGTEAYSSVIGEGVNILSTDSEGNITISAQYFTYTKNAATSEETFVWNIGNITDKEIALAFDAYLEGSMSGERPENVYYTNEEATVEYVDINGDYAHQTFPVPGVAWGGATTTIRFYLVNEKGEPVNRDGEVVPWANRVYVGDPVIITLNLNSDMEIEAQKIEAAANVPAGYFLYDQNAWYEVQTTSSDDAIVGGITVSDPSEDASKTTGTEPNVVTQTGAQTTRVISYEDPYYTWSIVGFGVRWDLTAEKTDYVLVGDQVVIDYGKAIQVDVLANDPVRDGYSREVVGFVKYTAGTDLSYIMQSAGSATFTDTAGYGTFSIVDGKVQFQPNKMMSGVQKVYYVAKYTPTDETQAQNFYYVYGQLDVIPATIMYYETDFAGVFTTTGSWTADKTVDGDNAADGPQEYVEIGSDLYGNDSTYEDDKYLSNGSSYYVEGDGVNTTYVNFEFTGTGFDLISRTGTQQGAIRVDVYSDAARSTRVKSVTVLNKSESAWELYQIPVASIEMSAHGTYYVTVRVAEAYTNDDYPVLTRGNQFYFDAIRVFNPIVADNSVSGSDAAIAYAAYEADGELNPQIVEVRNVLIDADTFNAAGDSTVSGVIYGEVVVDRPETEGETTQSNVEVSTYQTIGPNNEVYLSNGQAISFNVKTGSVAPKTFNLGVKSVNGETVNLEAYIFVEGNSTPVQTVTNTAITSSTIQFFTLFKEGDPAANTTYQVVITNTGSGVLSLTDLKFAGSTEAGEVEITSDETTVKAMQYALVYGVAQPEEEEEEPTFGAVSAEFQVETAKRGDTVTMVITTTADVDTVAVLNALGVKTKDTVVVSTVEENDQKVWTVTFTLTSAGTQTFTAVGYKTDDTGNTTAGFTADATIKVNIR